MQNRELLIELVRKRAEHRVFFSQHAIRQMSRPDRMISTEEIRKTIDEGKIIEEYPDDPRGHSCLMLGKGVGERPIHVVCSPKDEYLAIITAYLPQEQEWSDGFTVRKRS